MWRGTTTTRGAVEPPRTNSNGGDRLLALLQVTNAAFPTGTFTHSYGFETWLHNGVISNAAEAEARCVDWLRFNLATGDAAAVGTAGRDVRGGAHALSAPPAAAPRTPLTDA